LEEEKVITYGEKKRDIFKALGKTHRRYVAEKQNDVRE